MPHYAALWWLQAGTDGLEQFEGQIRWMAVMLYVFFSKSHPQSDMMTG